MAAAPSKATQPAHVMFSYCDCDVLATQVYQYLKKKLTVAVWMDKHDAKSASISSSIADAVQSCCAVVCFLSPDYQDTPACERELTYAANLGKPIIPCNVGRTNPFDDPDEDEDDDEEDWLPSEWLGLLVADLSGVNFEGVNKNNIQQKCDELILRINNVLPKNPSK